MSCGFCESCKFWKTDLSVQIPEQDWSWCEMAENHYNPENVHLESKAIAHDGEEYVARLKTRKDVGCTQHQEKP